MREDCFELFVLAYTPLIEPDRSVALAAEEGIAMTGQDHNAGG
jgi:hypothetical protein